MKAERSKSPSFRQTQSRLNTEQIYIFVNGVAGVIIKK